jgi:hypothetical protein
MQPFARRAEGAPVFHGAAQIAVEVHATGPDAYFAPHLAPAVIVGARSKVRSTETESAVDSKFATLSGQGNQGIDQYDGKIAFLLKGGQNPFGGMITIGRASNNDIQISLPSISKCHGFFGVDARGWTFTDQKSTNGSWLAGNRLQPTVPVHVGDGAVLWLGEDIELRFLTRASLRSFVLSEPAATSK